MNRITVAACMMVAQLGVAWLAQAETAAGWDFSQYYIDGIKLQDPAVPAPATLSSNYSSFDLTNGAGAEANAIGAATLTGGVLPAAGSLLENKSGAAVVPGDLDFDSHAILKSEGQVSQSYMSLSAGETPGAAQFRVDLGAAGVGNMGAWNLSFGGESSGGTSDVGVSFSTDCASWVNVGTVTLDDDPATPGVFSVPLASAASGVGCVALAMNPTSGTGGRPFVDNVVISVPEPGATAQLLAGATVLFALGRRYASR